MVFALEGISLRFRFGVVLVASSASAAFVYPNVVPGNVSGELVLDVVVVDPHAQVPMLNMFRIFIGETTL